MIMGQTSQDLKNLFKPYALISPTINSEKTLLEDLQSQNPVKASYIGIHRRQYISFFLAHLLLFLLGMNVITVLCVMENFILIGRTARRSNLRATVIKDR